MEIFINKHELKIKLNYLNYNTTKIEGQQKGIKMNLL